MDDDPQTARRRLIELFGRDQRRLTRFVEKRLWQDSQAEAEDIVSDVMLRLFERADLLAQVEDLTAYLYRALAHAVTDFFRRRRPLADPPAAARDAETGDGFWESLPDPSPDPEIAFLRREDRDRVSRALSRLSAPERAVWLATEIEGRTFRELAELWDVPIGTLLSRKSRAVKHLHKLLLDQDDNIYKSRKILK